MTHLFLLRNKVYCDYAFTRFTQEPSRVSTSMISPSLMKRGTRTSTPVSIFAGLSVW